MTSPPSPTLLAGVLLVNGAGDLLLQLRDSYAPRYPNVWTISGGHIDRGESPEAAARRELDEEAGLSVDTVELFWHGPASDGDHHVLWHVYCAKTTAVQDDVILGEGEAMVFVPASEVLDREFAPNVAGFREPLPRFTAVRCPSYRTLDARTRRRPVPRRRGGNRYRPRG